MKKSRSQSNGRSASTGRGSKSANSRTSTSSRKSTSGRSSSTSGGRTPAAASRGSSRSSSKSAPGSSKSSSSGRSGSSRTSPASRSVPSRSTSNGRAAATSRSKQTTPREDLHEVLKDGLKDIYYAEKQLVKALKKVSKAATSNELRDAFDNHRMQTEEQIGLLEQAFESMEMRVQGKKCPAMEGLIEEANEHIEEMHKGPALDAALIVGAQKIEHYEIAAYGSLRSFARSLGLSDCEQIFDKILKQESQTDELLTQVAEKVNTDALSGEEMTAASSWPSRAGNKVEVGEMEEQQM